MAALKENADGSYNEVGGVDAEWNANFDRVSAQLVSSRTRDPDLPIYSAHGTVNCCPETRVPCNGITPRTGHGPFARASMTPVSAPGSAMYPGWGTTNPILNSPARCFSTIVRSPRWRLTFYSTIWRLAVHPVRNVPECRAQLRRDCQYIH